MTGPDPLTVAIWTVAGFGWGFFAGVLMMARKVSRAREDLRLARQERDLTAAQMIRSKKDRTIEVSEDYFRDIIKQVARALPKKP